MRQALLRPGIYWHVFPTYGEGKDTAWRDPHMLFDIIPEQLIARKNESELIVYFKNGSIYQIKGADQPDRLRGPNPYGVVLDEFDTMKFEAWTDIIEPIIRINQGWVWFVGTYKGKLKLYEFQQRGSKISNFDEWKSWVLSAKDSGIMNPLELEKARQSMPAAKFNQELLCIPMEAEGSVFRHVREAAIATPEKPKAEHLYVMGLDLAKVQDFTVISIWDRSTNAQVYQDRFQTLEWPFQKKRIYEVAKYYNNALISADGTGIGDPIVDDLSRMGLAVEPVHITEPIKKEMIEKLSLSIETRRISLIPLQESLFEYDNFAYEIGMSGRIKYGARDGFHDDIVLSHALAVYHLLPRTLQIDDIDTPKIRSAYYQTIKNRYGDPDDSNDLDIIE